MCSSDLMHSIKGGMGNCQKEMKRAVECGSVSYTHLAASFTRCAQDILQIREILEENGCNTIKIIAKIENAQGVNNIDAVSYTHLPGR